MSFKELFLESIFPRRCPVCDRLVDRAGRYICGDCLKKLDFVREPTCMKCGKQIHAGEDEYCPDCQGSPRSYDYGIALLNYNDLAQKAMVKIKYKNKRDYAESFARLFVVRYGEQIRRMAPDCLVPVPVHARRLRERGYNQAELLARHMGELLGLEVVTDLLFREKKTLAQKELTAGERLKNLTGAFRADPVPGKYRRILLVDDIYTTGATIEACTRALREQGAGKVWFAAICIGKGT